MNRIHVYTVAYNEEHFVKNFLAAYKEAERIVVYDNMSTDRTKELLLQDKRVEVRAYDSNGQIRDDLYLAIKNHAWKEARGIADWVIVVDFDEIFCRAYRFDHEVVMDLDLRGVYNQGFNIIKPFGYNMVSLDAPLGAEGHPYQYSKLGLIHPPNDKMCVFRPDRIGEIRYFAGCHRCEPLDIEYTDNDIKVCQLNEYRLLHYKFWNLELYMKRMAEYQTRMSDVNKGMGWGWHYMQPLQFHKDMFINGAKIVKEIL